MAKVFAGFTPEQLGKIDPSLAGKQSDEQQKIIAANPALSARIGKMATTAQKRMMSQGGAVRGYATGGDIDWAAWQVAGGGLPPSANPGLFQAWLNGRQNQSLQAQIDELKNQAATASTIDPADISPSPASTMTKAITADPRGLTVKADVAQTDPYAAATGTIGAGTGDAGISYQAGTTFAPSTTPAQAATATPAAQTTAATAAPSVDQALASQQAAQGQVSQAAQMQAAQMAPTDAAQLQLQAAQGQAATVQGAPTRTLDQAELVSGSAVDQGQVAAAFGTGEVQSATVQSEMDSLMQDFQGTNPPAWAAGAMRNAAAQMAARGLGASSMAGQAAIQAAMESAIPIAQMDASNKTQVALFKAEQRAKFMGQEFDQNFQTKVMNAAKISEIANMNFNAQQQVALENAKMAQTMNLANLDNRQAKVMADAAIMSQLDITNLNNRQQAQVQNAQAFLQMDMTNLSNDQQMAMFKAQERVNSILSDQAAENASRQFNATSQNQTDQFFASLTTQVSQFNTEQKNAMNRFNAGEANAISQFNTNQANARDQFNAQNQLVIAQANAQWFQSITTAENAAANQANRDAAMAANNLTMTAYNNMVQRERDTLAWAWQSAENEKEIAGKIAIAKIEAEADKNAKPDAVSAASGKFLAAVAEQGAKWIFESIKQQYRYNNGKLQYFKLQQWLWFR